MEHSLWLVLVAIASAIGAYIGAYLKKKGENLATKEDIAVLTQTTKEIEGKIDDKFWNRQRLWELKRDSILASVQAMDRAKASFVALWAARLPKAAAFDPLNARRRQESEEEWLTAINEFDRTRSNISFLCGQPIRTEMAEISARIRTSGSLIFKDTLSDQEFVDLGAELKQRITRIHALARTELGIETVQDAVEPNPANRPGDSGATRGSPHKDGE